MLDGLSSQVIGLLAAKEAGEGDLEKSEAECVKSTRKEKIDRSVREITK